MAALVGGHAYGLSSHDKNSKSKTLIFVKLTDSALKSIEEYVKDPSKSVLKPTIQFKANNGLIRLTCGDSHVKSYGFNLSNVETDGPQGSFECEQERGSRSLESLGSMHVRMNINASEDSYEKTRVKMAAVEKENKKFCTKEIKPSGPYVGRKVKLKPSISSIPPKTSSPLYITPPQKSSSKLYTNSVSMSANNLSSSINSARQINGNRIAKHASTVQSQSCRSRIIHLLAAKPYNASELILKLTNEGIKEGEKKNINAILKQVAVLKDKEHSYTLTNEAWDEVQLDWKFYSQEDIENVRRRKLLHLKSRSESRVPSPTNVLSNNSPNQKRALSEWEVNNTDNRFKKQRISHLNRQSNNIPNNVANSSRAENSNQTNGEKLLANSYSMKKEVNGHVPNSCSVKKEMNGHAQNSCSAKKEMNGHAQISYSVKKEMNGHVTNSCSAKKEVNDRVQMSESNASQKYSSHLDSSFRMNGMHGKQDDNEKMDARKTPNQKLQNEAVHQNEETRQPHWLNSNYKNHKVSDPMQKAPSTNYAVEKTKESHRRSPVEKISRRVEEHDPVQHVKMNGVSQPKSYHSLDSNLLHATNTKQNIVSDSKKLSNGHHNGYVNGYSGSNHGPPIAANTKDVREADSTDCFHFDEQKYDTDPSEYYSQYPRINSKEQRARYKRDFNSDYEEYKILHDQMKRIANRFVELENKLKLSQLQDNTLDYYETQREIIEEYTDPFCFDGRKKLNYLHGKLSHIKKLVMEYDRSQVTSS